MGDYFSALGGSMTMSFTSGTLTAPANGNIIYFPFAGEALSNVGSTGTLFWTVTDTFGDSGGAHTAWALGSKVVRASVASGQYYEESLVYWRLVGNGAANGTITVSAKQADNSTATTGDGYFFFYPWLLTASGTLSTDQNNNGQSPTTSASTYAMSYGASPTGLFAGCSFQQDGASTAATVPTSWTSQNVSGHAAGIDIETAFFNGTAASNPSTWTGCTNSAGNRLFGATLTILESGGGTTFNGTLAQAFTFAETINGSVSVAGTLSQAFTFTEPINGAASVAGTLAQAFTFSETINGSVSVAGTISQAFTFTETINGAQMGTLDQSFTFTETINGTVSDTGILTQAFTFLQRLIGLGGIGATPGTYPRTRRRLR
jgi:hypothetical protein